MNTFSSCSCVRDDAETIPLSLVQELGITRHNAHTDASAIARLAVRRMEQANDLLCRLPFCVTVEAEAFGATVKIPDDESGPRCDGYLFSRIEELSHLAPMKLDRGRITEVLNSITLLHNEGYTVALNVEGPFTVLGLLIDSSTLFRGILTHRQILEQALGTLEESLICYIRQGIRHGASIISYADPAGALEVFGPKLYREIVGLSSHRLLQQLEGTGAATLIHLCGQTSRSLEKAGLCTAHAVEIPGGSTYGHNLRRLVHADKPILIGHNCMKSTPLVLNRPTIWQIKLT